MDSEYKSAEEHPMGDEATGQEDRKREQVGNAATQRADAGMRRAERQREALVLRREFEGKREMAGTVEQRLDERPDEPGEGEGTG